MNTFLTRLQFWTEQKVEKSCVLDKVGHAGRKHVLEHVPLSGQFEEPAHWLYKVESLMK